MIDLACKVQPPQRHAEQKTQPGHDAVTIADARSGLGNVKLKAADVLGRRRVRRAFEKRRKPLTAVRYGSSARPARADARLCPRSCADGAGWQHGYSSETPV